MKTKFELTTKQINKLQSQLSQREYQLKIAIAGLQRLARLGNEPLLGNSLGNQLAIQVLKECGIAIIKDFSNEKTNI